MKLTSFFMALILAHSTSLFAMGPQKTSPNLPTTSNVDLGRYLGKWYEIARKPLFFEKDCVGVTAEYSLRSDGKIGVKNSCRKNTCEGKLSVANGVGKVIDAPNNSKLKVSFFWPFKGDYWILELDSEYSYAVVGSPDRKSFWILSRSSTLPESLIQSIKFRFELLGFDFSDLVLTPVCD
jgi:apolipoprotein D and lipocalin family protein